MYKEPGAIDGSGNFLPRIVKVDGSTGCTLTNASIKGMTPAEFEGLGNKEIDLARVIASAAEAKILGVQEKGLPTLLRSSITNIKPLLNQQKVETQSLILPYIQRSQRSYINSNYFAGSGGQANANAGQNGNHPGLWELLLMLEIHHGQLTSNLSIVTSYLVALFLFLLGMLDTKKAKDLFTKVVSAADATDSWEQKQLLHLSQISPLVATII